MVVGRLFVEPTGRKLVAELARVARRVLQQKATAVSSLHIHVALQSPKDVRHPSSHICGMSLLWVVESKLSIFKLCVLLFPWPAAILPIKLGAFYQGPQLSVLVLPLCGAGRPAQPLSKLLSQLPPAKAHGGAPAQTHDSSAQGPHAVFSSHLGPCALAVCEDHHPRCRRLAQHLGLSVSTPLPTSSWPYMRPRESSRLSRALACWLGICPSRAANTRIRHGFGPSPQGTGLHQDVQRVDRSDVLTGSRRSHLRE